MRAGDEACLRRDLHDAQVRLEEQLARPFQTQLQVVVRRRTQQVLLEQPLKLPARQPDIGSQFNLAERLADVALHQFHGRHQLRGLSADHVAQRHVLPVPGIADSLVHELVGDPGADVRAQLPADEVQHHVHRRRAAGTGEAVAVDRVDAPADRDLGEPQSQGGEILPVDAAPVAVQQAGLGQHVAARAGGTQPQPPCAARVQPPQHRFCGEAFDPFAAADDDRIHGAGLDFIADTEIGVDREPVTCGNGAAVPGYHPPAIDTGTGHAVGHAQRLDRRRHGNEREVVKQQEAEKCRHRLRFGVCHRADSVL